MTEFSWFLLSIGFTIGIMGGATSGILGTTNTYQTQAAKTSCAQFSPETGDFEWLPKELKK